MSEWIAVDWGTSHLRAWVIGPGDNLLAALGSEDGMGKLSSEQFEPALLSLIDAYLPQDKKTLVMCSGMVGARQGWLEADYIPAPCYPAIQQNGVMVNTQDQRLDVRILPGVKQVSPADVMRGEETQIAGFLRSNPGFTGTICLPGTHTKWVTVNDQKIQSFSTCMTGELFALLSDHSVLRHSVSSDEWDEAAFLASVNRAYSDAAAVARQLFSLRAETLLHNLPAATARAQLSGMLIGFELACEKDSWLNQSVVVIGASPLIGYYAAALELLGVAPQQVDGDQMTMNGLTAAYHLAAEDV